MRRCPRGPFHVLKQGIHLDSGPLLRPRVVDDVSGESSLLFEWHLQRNALLRLLLGEAISSHQAFHLLRQTACHQNEAPKVPMIPGLDHERRIDNDPRTADLSECFQLCPDGSQYFRMKKLVQLVQLTPIVKDQRSQ